MRPTSKYPSTSLSKRLINRLKHWRYDPIGAGLTQGLVGYWPSADLKNYGTGGGTLTTYGTVPLVTGVTGISSPSYSQPIWTYGNNTGWLSSDYYNFTSSSFTVAFWTKGLWGPTGWNDYTTPSLWGSYTWLLGRGEWGIWAIPWEGRMYLWTNTNGSPSGDVTAYAAIPPENVWCFIVAWRDAVNQKISIQVNNGPFTLFALTSNLYYRGYTPTFAVMQGGRMYYTGIINQPMMWKDRVLTSSERNWLYNNGSGNIIPY